MQSWRTDVDLWGNDLTVVDRVNTTDRSESVRYMQVMMYEQDYYCEINPDRTMQASDAKRRAPKSLRRGLFGDNDQVINIILFFLHGYLLKRSIIWHKHWSKNDKQSLKWYYCFCKTMRLAAPVWHTEITNYKMKRLTNQNQVWAL